jgi:hypothetical protein
MNASAVIAGFLFSQFPQSRLGLLLGIVGATGFLLERAGILTVKPNESSGPAVANFVVAQDEPLHIGLREGGRCERCRNKSASEKMYGFYHCHSIDLRFPKLGRAESNLPDRR